MSEYGPVASPAGFHHVAVLSAATAVYGAVYGFFPIGWIVLNAVFLYNITTATGQFDIVRHSVAALLAVSGAATPSMAPCPKRSGCVLTRFSTK